MSLAHVLLTSLMEKPSTGIELAKRFDRSMGFFWHATHQQIYRELSQMLGKGWIGEMSPDDKDARKKTYYVQDLGYIEIRQWMIEHNQPSKLRDELMVKLRAEAQLGEDLIQPEIERHLCSHQRQLELYQQILNKDKQKNEQVLQDQKLQRAALIQQKILELGIQLETGWVTWLTEINTLLQTYPLNAPQDQEINDSDQYTEPKINKN